MTDVSDTPFFGYFEFKILKILSFGLVGLPLALHSPSVDCKPE